MKYRVMKIDNRYAAQIVQETINGDMAGEYISHDGSGTWAAYSAHSVFARCLYATFDGADEAGRKYIEPFNFIDAAQEVRKEV